MDQQGFFMFAYFTGVDFFKLQWLEITDRLAGWILYQKSLFVKSSVIGGWGSFIFPTRNSGQNSNLKANQSSQQDLFLLFSVTSGVFF